MAFPPPKRVSTGIYCGFKTLQVRVYLVNNLLKKKKNLSHEVVELLTCWPSRFWHH